ncbi:MAG: phosphate regulon sensor histidine kinase PhoR [Gammaproteobacteria bacterium]|nr:phosphate regulon sensor histidine kinase PhoR [Gammaproteobacteria bacterium]
MFNPWSAEFRRLFFLLLLALIAGLLFGEVALLLFLVLAGYLGWHLRNLHRLYTWFNEGRRFHPPEAAGIWGDVFNLIDRYQLRNRKRKKRLTALIKRFQEATAAMPDATMILDADGGIEWFNGAAQSLLGLQAGRDVGQRIVNLIRNPEFRAFLALGSPGEPLRMASPVNEHIILSFRVVPYGKEQRLLIARDVSQQQRLEQMRRDFVANVSHELRTPLTVVNGFLETLSDEGEITPEQLHRSLQLMSQQARRMSQIVEDLLLLSRLETDSNRPPRERVAVAAMLQVAAAGLNPLAQERGLQLQFECDERLWLYGAEKELYSAFSNLITNALRYTPQGGRVTVRWHGDSQGAHFEVEDTGVGIAPHHIPRLTERFYRVDVGRSRDVGGTGLGLAIVKHVLNRHHANLRIRSTLNRGSTFSCHFPPELIVGEER